MAIREIQAIPETGEHKKKCAELYADAKESFPNTSGIFHSGLRGFINFFGRVPCDHGEVSKWISLDRNPEEILKVQVVKVQVKVKVKVKEIWAVWVEVEDEDEDEDEDQDPKRPGYGYWKRVASKDLEGDY